MLYGRKGLLLPSIPITGQNLQRLLVLFEPLPAGVEKNFAFGQQRLATLTVLRPFDVVG